MYDAPIRFRRFPAILAALALAALVFASGCSSKQAAPADAAPADAPASLSFFDSFTFDRQLSSSLRADLPEVEVVFPAAVTINSIPPRLEKWLSMVDQTGGKVQLVPEATEGKGFVSEIISLFVKVAEYIKEKTIYGPIENYDAQLHYKQGSGIMTRTVFVRRTTATSEAEPPRREGERND